MKSVMDLKSFLAGYFWLGTAANLKRPFFPAKSGMVWPILASGFLLLSRAGVVQVYGSRFLVTGRDLMGTGCLAFIYPQFTLGSVLPCS